MYHLHPSHFAATAFSKTVSALNPEKSIKLTKEQDSFSKASASFEGLLASSVCTVLSNSDSPVKAHSPVKAEKAVKLPNKVDRFPIAGACFEGAKAFASTVLSKIDSPVKEESPVKAESSIKLPDNADRFSIAGASFEGAKSLDDGTKLHARHKSHLVMMGMSISAATLYMDAAAPLSKGEDVLNPNVPKVLEVHYMRHISAAHLSWVTKDTVSGNGFAGSSIEDGVKQWNRLYQDVRRGDSYCVAYAPDKTGGGSVTLSKNGTRLGAVTGGELSSAIFSVWFGEYVWFKQMRDDLLGLSGEVN